MKHAIGLSLAAAALAVAAPAVAAPYLFTLTGDYSASFTLDSHPTISGTEPGLDFYILDVAGTYGGLDGNADAYFFNAANDGGIELHDSLTNTLLVSAEDQVLFTGGINNPTFKTGSFALTEYNGTGSYTLTIAPTATGAVPEPATWAMMIAGFGLVGGAARASRRSVAFAA